MYIHGSAIDYFPKILLSGNLTGEALGETAVEDNFSFHVDFSTIQSYHLEGAHTPEEVISRTFTALLEFGSRAELGQQGQVILLYDRSNPSWEPGIQHHETTDLGHSLILGGIPSTEISGMLLRSPEATLEKAKRAIVENGFYLPLYDMQGNLLFTAEEYDEIVEDYNLGIPVAIWDTSLRTGDKLGSNPGGTFTITTDRGPVAHYVKFVESESVDQLWSELLADKIYEDFGKPVPNTQIVMIEGAYGHAS